MKNATQNEALINYDNYIMAIESPWIQADVCIKIDK